MVNLMRSGDAGEEDALAVAAGDCFFAVTFGLVAGPKADGLFVVTEIDDMMAALLTADFFSPPDFEEVTGLGFLPRGEVDAAVEIGD